MFTMATQNYYSVIERLGRISQVLTTSFPWIVFISLLATLVVLVLREKRMRALELSASEEDRRIMGLSTVSEAEKQALLKAAGSLPVVREKHPLPDFHLRLVSAFSKVFSGLKIIMFLAFGSFYLGVWLVSRSGHYDFTFSTSNPLVFVFFLSVILVLSVLQFRASIRLTRGSNGARWFLIFMVIWELTFLRGGFWVDYTWLAQGVILSLCLYSLWVLLWRPRALKAVIFTARAPRLWQTCAVTGIAILALCGLITTTVSSTATNKTSVSTSKVTCDSSSVQAGNAMYAIDRIVLKAGDASRETARLTRNLRKSLPIPATCAAYETPDPLPLGCDDLLLIVTKTIDRALCPEEAERLAPKPAVTITFKDSSLPKAAQKKVLAQLRKELGGMWRLPDQQTSQPSAYDHQITFVITSIFGNYCRIESYGNQAQYIGYPAITVTCRGVYTGDRETVLDKITVDAGAKLKGFLDQYGQTRPTVKVPENLLPEVHAIQLPDLEILRSAKQIANSRSLQHEQISLLRLAPDTGVEAFKTAVEAAGWKSVGWDREIQYKKGTENLVVFGNQWRDNDAWASLWVLYTRGNKKVYTPEEIEHFCRTDFGTFIYAFQPQSVPAAVFSEAADNFLQNDALSATTLLAICRCAGAVDELRELQGKSLVRAAETLMSEPRDVHCATRVQTLMTEALKLPPQDPFYQRMSRIFGPSLIHIDLEKRSGGFYAAEYETDQALGQIRILTLKATDQKKNQIFVVLYMGDTAEGQHVFLNGGSGVGSTRSTMSDRVYRRQVEFKPVEGGDGFYSSGTGWWHPWETEMIPDPRDFAVDVEMNAETGRIRVKVVYNSDVAEFTDFQVDLRPDGTCEYDGVVYSQDELIDTWCAQNLRDKYVSITCRMDPDKQWHQYSQFERDVRKKLVAKKIRFTYKDMNRSK